MTNTPGDGSHPDQLALSGIGYEPAVAQAAASRSALALALAALDAAPEPPDDLAPLPYHHAAAQALRVVAGPAWDRLAQPAWREAIADAARLELLRRATPLPAGEAPALQAAAERAARALGVEAPVFVHRSGQRASGEAALCYLPGEVHLLVDAAALAALPAAAALALLGHEIGHFRLWESEAAGTLLVASRLLEAAAAEPRCDPAHSRTAARFRLATEIYADRAALHAAGDGGLAAVEALLARLPGSVAADGAIAAGGPQGAGGAGETGEGAGAERGEGETEADDDAAGEDERHDEHAAGIRRAALSLWAARRAGAHSEGDSASDAATEAEVERLITGALRLETLDLPGQLRLAELFRRLVSLCAASPALATEAIRGHAGLYIEDGDAAAGAEQTAAAAAAPLIPGDLADLADSALDALCYAVLDLVACRRETGLDDAALAAALAPAAAAGLGERLAGVLHRELRIPKGKLTKLLRSAAEAVS